MRRGRGEEGECVLDRAFFCVFFFFSIVHSIK